MIPNDFGLIRQKDHNLFALLFPTLTDISEYYIEVIYVDENSWINNRAVTVQNADTSVHGMKYATVNIQKYDYVLIPCSMFYISSTGIYNGTTSDINDLVTKDRIFIRSGDINNKETSAYFFIKRTEDKNYILTNQRMTDNMPIIGFMRHRSDNVNPKGIIKDVNSDILQPVKKDELNGEAIGGGDELPGNAESSDLDSVPGAGADERANS